ncbi:acetyl esterase/lipase [Roseimicrobium gellanilyticum]|uniref:Acetyl esterase/lipase n=1 Tax=Roseimicrobium gellanilyticum TaxID=748857 RepID=A0A366HDE4_9BACT|nr:alpha/beta hydrolase [Roseimicrobium gellanilyticum]RBP39745.1 acetyl esterase/lipase [Roseimicrobium gellanilyticum]
MKPHILLLLPVLGAWLSAPSSPLRAQQSTTTDQAKTVQLLQKEVLKRYPESDKDKDGKLSAAEWGALQLDLKKRGLPPSALAPKPAQPNARYGPHERNVLDFWKAETKEPAPVLVFIHGGGFLAGNKDHIAPQSIVQCLANGVSFASINYRYSSQAIYPAPMLDGARAIQFLRSKAKEWNIDPKRIGAFGGSAGAGISMWVGFHEDLAKPDSSDPIERESSRLLCIGTLGGQGTYDPLVIKEWIGLPPAQHPALIALYGVKTFEDFSKPEIRKLATDAAAMTHLTKDDPPLFMVYSEADERVPATAKPGFAIHHPIFGHKLKESMDSLGIENVYRHTDDKKTPAAPQAMMDWLIGKLKE